MRTLQALATLVVLLLVPCQADAAHLNRRASNTSVPLNAYAPQPTKCPSTPLVRSASSLGTQEAKYITSRRKKADQALAKWLKGVGATFDESSLPAVALGNGAGGYRALLNGAGVVQAMDSRDSTSSVSGLYQAFTYQAAISGGGWFLSSLLAQDWPTVSYLQKKIYDANFPGGLLVPPGSFVDFVWAYSQIVRRRSCPSKRSALADLCFRPWTCCTSREPAFQSPSQTSMVA